MKWIPDNLTNAHYPILLFVATSLCFGCSDSLLSPEDTLSEKTDASSNTSTVPDKSEPTRTAHGELYDSDGTDIQVEGTDPDGRYPEVLRIAGCTGTVIAPYTVLTAAHCPNTPSDNTDIGYPNDPSGELSNLQIAGADAIPHYGFKFNGDYLIHDRAGDGASRSHDLSISFVPSITPEWINKHLRFNDEPHRMHPVGGTVPMVDPLAPTDDQESVGLVCDGNGCSSNNTGPGNYPVDRSNREHDWSSYDSSYTGYEYSLDSVRNNQGDSGGPTVGNEEQYLPWDGDFGAYFHYNRHLVGVHWTSSQDAPVSRHVLKDSSTPMELNARQKEAVKVNQQWLRATASDADEDSLPYLCDGDPTTHDPEDNICHIASFGSNNSREPKGMLKCRPGFVATGAKGSETSSNIETLSIRCTPPTCLRNTSDNCEEEYWTQPFGDLDPDGTNFGPQTCGDGRVMTDVKATHEPDDLSGLQFKCWSYESLIDDESWRNSKELGYIGGYSGTTSAYDWCGDYYNKMHEPFVGFQLHSDLKDPNVLEHITGIQPVCSSDSVEETEYFGSTEAETRKISCPKDSIGVGFAHAEVAVSPDDLGTLGIVCMKKNDYENQRDPESSDVELLVSHNQYNPHHDSGNLYPRAVEKLEDFTSRDGLEGGLDVTFCAAGTSVVNAHFQGDSSRNDYITSLDWFECQGHGTTVTKYPWEGGAGDVEKTLSCDDPSSEAVNGFIMADGWYVDGASLLCGPK